MSASEAIRDFIEPILGAGWEVQFGAWDDKSRDTSVAVVRPVGGGRVELVRRPQFTLTLIGAEGQSAPAIQDKANQIIEAMRVNSGDLVSIAEVVRDLHRTDDQREQSYSERQLYEAALERLTREVAAVSGYDEAGAQKAVDDVPVSRAA